MADLRALQLPPAYDGWDAASAPESIPNSRAPVIQNFLVDRKGKILMRGPLTPTYDSIPVVIHPAGIWTYGDNFLIGARDTSVAGRLEPQQTRYLKTSVSTDLAKADPTKNRYYVNNVASTVASGSVDLVPGPRFTRLGNTVYGHAYDSSTVAVSEDGGFVTRRKLLKWDGTAGGLTALTNAPEGGQDIVTYLSRLFVFGGRDVPSGSPGLVEKNALYWTIPGGPSATDLATDWKDSVSGLVNKIIVDDDDDFLVGGARIQQTMVIFKRRSTHLLQGSTPSTFSIRRYSSVVGCLDNRSIVEFDNGVLFMSDQGLQYFDGVTTTMMSDDVNPVLRPIIQNTVGDNATASGFCRGQRLTNNYISVTAGYHNADGSANVQFSALLHVPSKSWTVFSSSVLAQGTMPLVIGRSFTRSYIFDGKNLVGANYITVPEGTTTGSETIGSTTKRIPARWWSHLVKLSQPLQTANLHRFLIDYQFIVSGSQDDVNSGFYVSLVNGRGVTLMTERQLPAAGDTPQNYLYRRQQTFDTFPETSDLQLRVEWKDDATGSNPALTRAEVYNSTVEFAGSRLRGSG